MKKDVIAFGFITEGLRILACFHWIIVISPKEAERPNLAGNNHEEKARALTVISAGTDHYGRRLFGHRLIGKTYKIALLNIL